MRQRHAEHDDVERAARLLWQFIGDEGKLFVTRREFLDTSRGLDRGAIVRLVAERLVKAFNSATIAEAERAVWKDVNRFFGWRDLADVEPRGNA